MPRQGVKNEIIKRKVELALLELEFVDDDDHVAHDEVMDELIEELSIISSSRRGTNYHVPKSFIWRTKVLPHFNEERFLQMLRVTKMEFKAIVELVRHDDCFKPSVFRSQMPVENQVAIVLFRLGSSGEAASIKEIAKLFGIGDGGTIGIITDRVFGAIIRKLPQLICWPSAAERKKLALETMDELPYCIGYIDGTEIKLARTPRVDHKVYFSRKRIYAIKMQVVCDHHLRIINAVVGSPGSYHDAKILRNCALFKEHDKYLSGEEWIAGDSEYPLSRFIVTPYRCNATSADPTTQKIFNALHSQYRVRVENCFGLLKGKFPSLKEMRINMRNKNSHSLLCKWVLVCCALHNFLLNLKIENDSDEDFDDDEYASNEFNLNFGTTPEEKRQAIAHFIINN